MKATEQDMTKTPPYKKYSDYFTKIGFTQVLDLAGLKNMYF